MEGMRKYVEKFLRNHRSGLRYLHLDELNEVFDAVAGDPYEALTMFFDYAYARGYKAAQRKSRKAR